MTRTRWAGHTLTATTIGLLACAIYTALAAGWWSVFAFIAAWTCAALASGTYLRAHREERIARHLAQLRDQPARDPEPPPRPPCCLLWVKTGGKVHADDGTCMWPDWARTRMTEQEQQTWRDLAGQLRKDTPA